MSVTLTNLKHAGGQLKLNDKLPVMSPSYWDPDKYGSSRITYLDRRTVRGVVQGNGEVGGLSTAAVDSGKWYWEITILSIVGSYGDCFGLGICLANNTTYATHQWDPVPSRWTHGYNNVTYFIDNLSSDHHLPPGGSSPFVTNDIIQFALDVDNGYFYMGRNGAWMNGATNAGISAGLGANHVGAQLPAGQTWTPMYYNHPILGRNDTWTIELNAGHETFAYNPPNNGFHSGI